MFIIGGEVYEDEEILGSENYDDLSTPLISHDDDNAIDDLCVMWENKLKI
jgi:hypothetical protein